MGRRREEEGEGEEGGEEGGRGKKIHRKQEEG